MLQVPDGSSHILTYFTPVARLAAYMYTLVCSVFVPFYHFHFTIL